MLGFVGVGGQATDDDAPFDIDNTKATPGGRSCAIMLLPYRDTMSYYHPFNSSGRPNKAWTYLWSNRKSDLL